MHVFIIYPYLKNINDKNYSDITNKGKCFHLINIGDLEVGYYIQEIIS